MQYITRAFVVGDRIQLKNLNGTVLAAGVVEAIAPMATTLRDTSRIPISISNKASWQRSG